MPDVHPTAQISPEAEIADDARVGPWCVLEGRVTLGPRVRLLGNVSINGPATIGAGTTIYPFACIGYPGQDFKFALDHPTAGVAVGQDSVIREHVTIHAATGTDRPTTIGDHVMMMVGSHAGHDASVGDDAVLVNAVLLGGHVHVGAQAVLGGGAVFHQHVRVGRLAMVSGGSRCAAEVPPFCMAVERNLFSGVNVVGLRRAGVHREEISRLRRACREAFASRLSRDDMIERLRPHAQQSPMVAEVLEFVATASRPICTGSGSTVVPGRRRAAANATHQP